MDNLNEKKETKNMDTELCDKNIKLKKIKKKKKKQSYKSMMKSIMKSSSTIEERKIQNKKYLSNSLGGGKFQKFEKI